MPQLLKHRSDTAANWTDANPTLLRGEFGIEMEDETVTKIKIGDGVTAWNDLDYSFDGGGAEIVVIDGYGRFTSDGTAYKFPVYLDL